MGSFKMLGRVSHSLFHSRLKSRLRKSSLVSSKCSKWNRLTVQLLETRQLLAFGMSDAVSVFPDALGYTDPAIRSAILAVTTTGSQEPIYLTSSDSGDGDGSIRPFTAQSGNLIGLNTYRADPRFTASDGSGFAAVILDTGIDLNHTFFGPDADTNGVADRIVYSQDFANGDADATDHDGHGSNVSSIIGSQDNTHRGMAPGADLIHLKVFTDAGAGNFGFVEDALQWVIANANTYNIASINMSLGDSANHTTTQGRYGIGDEIAALAAMDVFVVSAQGNDFFEFSSAQGSSYPAADANSIAVGAVYDANIGGVSYGGAIANTTGPGRVAPFSQRHSVLTDIMAPGAAITGASESGGTVTMHGTSQASPHIAGIAVLAQDLADQYLGRRLTQPEFVSLMRSSATTVNDGDDENDNVTNTGLDFPLVNVFNLAEAIYDLAEGPSAIADADDIITESVAPQLITVTYSDTTGVDVSDIGTGDILVTGPGGFSEIASFIGLDNNSDGTPRVATYELAAPGGSWGFEDNGNYIVNMVLDEVTDTDENSVPEGNIGSFVVNVVTSLGPDGMGYYASAYAYSFEDISATGTEVLIGADDNAALIEPGNGFSFEFYGQAWDSLFVSSNGLITFADAESAYTNTDFTTEPVLPAIAALWDDLVAPEGLGVYWELLGTGEDQRLVMQWETEFFGVSGAISFQAVLFESDNSVVVNYRDLQAGSGAVNEGASATVGIKDGGEQGANRLLVGFNDSASDYVGTGKSIRFIQVNEAPTDITLTNNAVAENLPAGSVVGSLITTDTNLGDTHTYEFSIGSGDDDNGQFVIEGDLLKIVNAFDFETQPSYSIRVKSTDQNGAAFEKSLTVVVDDLAEVSSITIGGGAAQRANVRSLEVTFDGEVNIDANAFEVTKRGAGGGAVGTSVTTSLDGLGRTVATIVFSGPFTRGGSLVDGNYQLTINASLIDRNGLALDGDLDGIVGGDRFFGTDEADNFYAFYGDTNGDRTISLPEFNAFRSAFGKAIGDGGYNDLFDFDGNEAIDLTDFNQFRQRFGQTFGWS